ncbi:MAG: 50S ribosomal protein L31 [Anaerolineaceae bacterium]|nr:50S ribosomal protein L31 [Anaerolineaceae bacterium]
MKTKIQPKYYPNTKISCASCGSTWETGSTLPEIRTEVCSNCHPFYTGQQAKILDREGQVDRFYKRLQVRQDYVSDKKAAEASKTSPERPVSDFKLSSKSIEALKAAGINTVADIMAKLEGGEKALLEVEGFGRKSLIDLKKQLRQFGYELPAAAQEIEI